MLNKLALIGQTPTIKLPNFVPNTKLFAKLESFNPLSSVKDRAACGMITAAEKTGELEKGSLIIETSSGNTGIALAWIARLKGYRLIITMPESMSSERRQILKFLGAEVVLTPKEAKMAGALQKAQEIKTAKEKTGEKVFYPNQFENPANPDFHAKTTGPEIWEDLKGEVDFAVLGVGTGGTLTGAGGFLKEKNPNLKIIAVEPAESPVISGGTAGAHKIQGLGAGFIPKNLKMDLIHKIETVTSEEAIGTSQELAQKEGLFVGISSGAAACAAKRVALANPAKTVITVFPDTAERYFSTDLFQ